MRYLFELVLILIVGFAPSIIDAQLPARTTPDEYIESSSPLPNGGRVTSRSTPQNGIQTITTTGEVPADARRTDARSSLDFDSVFRLSPQAANSGVPGLRMNPNGRAVYPYPATSLPRQPLAGPVQARLTNTQVTYPAFRARAITSNQQLNYQVPTLGITPNARTARNTAVVSSASTRLPITATQNRIEMTAARVPQNGVCVPQTTLQVAGYQVPASDPFATLAAPSLRIQQPGVAPQYNPGTLQQQSASGLETPNIGLPQFGSTPNQWWSPFLTGSGAYQPLLGLVNMKPGTHVGRGIIGQPTAYVDGQPVRNLLRYIFP